MNNTNTLNKEDTNIMNNTNELNTEENTNRIMSKEVYLQLVKEFKDSTKNKEFKPYWGQDWNGDKMKKKGAFSFEHYIFYAVLRVKDPAITTHDVLSETYADALYYVKRSYKSMNKIMPSLTEDLFNKVIASM